MRYLVNIAINIGILAWVLSSCIRGPSLFKQDGSTVASTIAAVEDSDGVVTGQFSAASGQTQTLSASTTGEIAGSQVAFPAGALAINTNITIEQGISFAGANTGSSLGIGTVDAAGPSVVITSSEAIDAGSPFTLQIPTTGASLALADDTDSRTVILFKYKVAAEGKSYLGIIPRDQIVLEGGYASFETKYFGAYQVSITETVIKEVKRIESDVPIVTKAAEKKLVPIVWDIGTGSYGIANHEMRIPINVTGFKTDVMCSAFVHKNKSSAPFYVDSTSGYEPLSEIDDYDYRLDLESEAMTLYVRFECTSRDGRHSLSQWSEGVAVPKGPGKPVIPTIPEESVSSGLADPGSLVVTSHNRISMNVTWSTPSSSDVVGYRLVYATGTHPASCEGTQNNPIDYDGATNITDVVRNLTPGTEYFFRVCSKDTSGNFSKGIFDQGHTDTTAPSGIGCTAGQLDSNCTITDLSSTSTDLAISGAGNLTISNTTAYQGNITIDMLGDVTIDGYEGFSTDGSDIRITAKNVYINGDLKSYKEYEYGTNGGSIDIYAGGEINVTAAMMVSASGINGLSGAGGNGGNILLTTNELTIASGARIVVNGGNAGSGGGNVGGDAGGIYIDVWGSWDDSSGSYIKAMGGIGGDGSVGGNGGYGGDIMISDQEPSNVTCNASGGTGGTGSPNGTVGVDGSIVGCGAI